MLDAFVLFLFWLFGIYGLMSIILEVSAFFSFRKLPAKTICLVDCEKARSLEADLLSLMLRLANEKGMKESEIWLLTNDPDALPSSVKEKATAVISKEKYHALFNK